jgi:hypothetical protein
MLEPKTVRERVEEIVVEALLADNIDPDVSKRIMKRIENTSVYIKRHMDEPATDKWVGIATMSLTTLVQESLYSFK